MKRANWAPTVLIMDSRPDQKVGLKGVLEEGRSVARRIELQASACGGV
jgi:hypothetical protein